jgi:hypothetical protein
MKIMKYGIEITKPWSKEMYDHNDKVADLMKAEILLSIKNNKNDFDKLNDLLTLCGGIKCGEGYDTNDVYQECKKELENVQNFWLNEEWDYSVNKLKIVNDINIEFIGYGK